MRAFRAGGSETVVRARMRLAARATLVTALLAIAARCALAQPEPPIQPPSALKKMSLAQLFDLEVTSVSRKPEALSKTAAAAHVVTQDDLSRKGALALPEALRDIPGVEVARVDSRQYAITARGFNGTIANKLLVLVDGRSVYTPLYSGVFWDAQDTFIEDIEQIEVIRGPGATVWGANAVNGVINVLTKEAAQTQGLLITGGAGNAEHAFGGARYGGALGSRGFYRAYGKTFDRAASLLADGRDAGDGFKMSQGGFRIDWAPSASDGLTIQGDAYGGSVRQPGTGATDLSGGNAIARWTRRFSEGSDLELKAYYDRTERDIPAVFGETLDTYDVTARHRLPLGGRHDVVWGVGYRQTRDRVRNGATLAFLPARLTRELFTCFVQDEFALVGDRLRATVGSKFEHNDDTGFEYQPSVRLAWTPATSHTVWAAASRAVRSPSRIDQDLFAPATPPYLLVGSPDFESEVLRALELGYKVQATQRLTASVATFYDHYDHLRSLEMGPPAFLANRLEGNAYGCEGEAAYQVSSSWRVNPGIALFRMDLRATAGSTDVTQESQEDDSPRVQLFVRSSLELPSDVGLDVTVRHIGELPNQDLPAYTSADARLDWRPFQGPEIAVVGQNLLEPRHAEFGRGAARREVRRGIYGKVTLRF